MSAASVVKTVIRASPHLALMSVSLSWTYLSLGWRVRKARRAFEEQLVLQGMAKDDAERLSACFKELKDNIVGVMKQSVGYTLRR